MELWQAENASEREDNAEVCEAESAEKVCARAVERCVWAVWIGSVSGAGSCDGCVGVGGGACAWACVRFGFWFECGVSGGWLEEARA